MIKWTALVDTVHKHFIEAGICPVDASVGEFEFGGLSVTTSVYCTTNPDTGAILLLDESSLPFGGIQGRYNGKRGLDWFTFVNFIENLCIKRGILPSEVSISHLEVRNLQCVTELSIFVDERFKNLCITDPEDRINGTKLEDILTR